MKIKYNKILIEEIINKITEKILLYEDTIISLSIH